MRLFIVVMSCVWVLAVLAVIYTLPGAIDSLAVKGLNFGVASGRIRFLETLDYFVNLTQYTEVVPSPFYTLARADLEEDVGREVFNFLVQKSFNVNGDASYNFHPLTAAFQNGRLNIASWLITQPNIISEVYIKKMICDRVKAVYPNITLILEEGETRRCAFSHPRLARYASSKLKLFYEATYKRPQTTFWMDGVGPVGGVPDAEWWKYTARNLHPLYGTIDKPWTVLNPAYFEDFMSVFFYYWLSPLEDMMNTLTLAAAFVFSLLWLSSWTRALS